MCESMTEAPVTLSGPAPPRLSWLRWSVRLTGLLLTVVVLLLWWNWYALLAIWGEFLNVGQPLDQRVEVVFILGGDLETRPFVAAEVFHAGYTDQILVSQPQPHSMDFLGGRTEGELTREVLLRLGVPKHVLTDLPLTVDSSRGELEAFRDYLQHTKPRRAAIVTSDFHTRRVSVLLSRICQVEGVELVLISAPVDACTPANWWRSEAGLGTYLLETVKLVSVYLHTS